MLQFVSKMQDIFSNTVTLTSNISCILRQANLFTHCLLQQTAYNHSKDLRFSSPHFEIWIILKAHYCIIIMPITKTNVHINFMLSVSISFSCLEHITISF